MMEEKIGKVVIISAPSGAGKTTLVKKLLDAGLKLKFSVSATSRAKRNNETDGKDYFFISPSEFRKRISEGKFIEWEEVYPEHFYGTLKDEIVKIHNEGFAVIFDVDVKGGISLKKIFGKSALSVFIMPPSLKDLEMRLRKRSTETEESLNKRVGKAITELSYAGEFDQTVVNDDLEEAFKRLFKLVSDFLKSE